RLNLSDKSVENSIEITKKEIRKRIDFYHKNEIVERTYESIVDNTHIFIVDDGLASGFTMLAAIKMIKKYNPKSIYIAIPTAPFHTINRIQSQVDEIYCPDIRKTSWFAVADAYKHWYDVPESEVLNILKKSDFYLEDYKGI
ncbi:MAG: phosphoribosyltransferase family protein, partial [Promethearchaeota archaeon]